jgi:zinc protease
MLSAVPAKGQTIEQVESALLAQIARVQTHLVDPSEMERVRNQLIASKVYELDSLFYQAMLLGQMETVGLGWELADTYVDQLAAVTPEQVRRVAQTYLIPDRLTVGVLDPQPMDASTTARAPLATEMQVHVH